MVFMATQNDSGLGAGLAWYRAHPKTVEQYREEWVAIGPGGILAHDKDIKTVLAESKSRDLSSQSSAKYPPTEYWPYKFLCAEWP